MISLKVTAAAIPALCVICMWIGVAITGGCGTDRKMAPLTETEIMEMSRVKPAVAALEIVNSPNSILNETLIIEEHGDSNLILSALLPIQSAKDARLDTSKIDYVFHFQAGKNPANFSIAVDENHEQFKYQVDQFTYVGGQRRMFEDAVALLREKYGSEKEELKETGQTGLDSADP